MGEKNFPAILWEMISQENLPIKWDRSGRAININFEELDKYLQLSESILPMKNQVDFVLQLFNWGFRRSSWTKKQKREEKFPEIYFNQFFKRNNPNLLTLMNPMDGIRKNGKVFVRKNHFRELRVIDPCCRIVRKLPQRETTFNHLATVVAFTENKRNFKKKLNKKRALNLSMGSTSWKEMEVDPTEDSEKLKEGEMAGFYGLQDEEKLKAFLGAHAPIFALQNSDTFTPNFAPQITSTHIWDTPILENPSTEVFSVSEIVSKTEDLTFSTAKSFPEDDHVLDNAMIETNPDHHEVSLQIQESFNVLYNC